MLKRFCEQLSLEFALNPPLAPNEDGSYSINFEPKIKVKLTENEEKVIKFSAHLAKLPVEKKDDYLLEAMSNNLFGAGVGGNMLGLDAESKNVLLTRLVNPEESYLEFRSALEEFVNYAESWSLETKAFA